MNKRIFTIIVAAAAALLMTASCKQEKVESPIFRNYWIMEMESPVIYKFNSNNTVFVGSIIDQDFLDDINEDLKKDPECYRDSQKELFSKIKINDWKGSTEDAIVTENSDASGVIVMAPGTDDEETISYSIAEEKLTITIRDAGGIGDIVMTSASAKGIKLGKMYPYEELEKPNYAFEHLWLCEALGDGYSKYGYIRILESGTVQKGKVVSEAMINSLTASVMGSEKYSDTAKEIIRSLEENDLLFETNCDSFISPEAGSNTKGHIGIAELNITNEKYEVNDNRLRILSGNAILYEFQSAASLGIEPGEEYLMSAIQPISEN